MSKNRILVMIGLVFFVSALIAFVFFNGMGGSLNNDGKLKIGLALDTSKVEKWVNDSDIFITKAKELGATVITQNAEDDSNEQIKQIKNLMDQRIDVLVVIPVNSDEIMPIVKEAMKKGIKVISYDKIVRNSNIDLFVTFDYEKTGKLMAEALTNKVAKGKFVIINGDENNQNDTLTNFGVHNVLDPKIESGDIKIVNEIWVKNWDEKDAYNCVKDLLTAGKKIDGIIAGNDKLAESAVRALTEFKLTDKVKVVGQDAALTACQRVVEGTQLMTVYKPTKTMAAVAAEAAVKLANDEQVAMTTTIQDGTYNVPVIIEDVKLVNKENMVEVIVNNKFTTIEALYKNVPKNQWPKTTK